jgi:hypothetical protein
MDTTTNGTALAIVPAPSQNPSASTQLEPSSAEQAFTLATHLVKSGLLGRNIQKPEAAFAIILAGRELGLTAMQSLRSIHIIEGKPTLSSDLMVALVKRSPTCKFFRMVQSTDTVATYETDRVGEGATKMSFTMEDAKRAGVASKNNWKTYPAAMLRARCIAQLARVVYPDLLMGIYETDEIAPSNVMPIAREEAPGEPATPPVELDSDVIERWTARMNEAATLADLDAVGAACKAEVTDKDVLKAIGLVYAARKTALTPTESPKEN